MRVVVTGGAGFIGARSSRGCATGATQVVAVVRDPATAAALRRTLGVELVAERPRRIRRGLARALRGADARDPRRRRLPDRDPARRSGRRCGTRTSARPTRVLDAASAARVPPDRLRLDRQRVRQHPRRGRRRDVPPRPRRRASSATTTRRSTGPTRSAEERIAAGAPIVIVHARARSTGRAITRRVGEQLQPRLRRARCRIGRSATSASGSVHVDDLAAGIVAALDRGAARRVVRPVRARTDRSARRMAIAARARRPAPAAARGSRRPAPADRADQRRIGRPARAAAEPARDRRVRRRRDLLGLDARRPRTSSASRPAAIEATACADATARRAPTGRTLRPMARELPMFEPTAGHAPPPGPRDASIAHRRGPARSARRADGTDGAPPPPRLDQGPDAVRRELPRPQGPAPRPEPQHGLRGGPLPEHRGVLGPAHRHDHDPRRHLHPGLRLLRRQDRPADLVRRRRAAPRRRGGRRAGPRARRGHERRPRRPARRRRAHLRRDDPRSCARRTPGHGRRGPDPGLQRRRRRRCGP